MDERYYGRPRRPAGPSRSLSASAAVGEDGWRVRPTVDHRAFHALVRAAREPARNPPDSTGVRCADSAPIETPSAVLRGRAGAGPAQPRDRLPPPRRARGLAPCAP